jgi:toxin ParE1/3/4
MNRRILIHEDASLDLQEHCTYLSQNSRDSAFRFFDAARQTFAALAQMPGMGNLYESEEEIVNVRKWAVKEFKKYLIFYRYDDETLEILRIIHATRDLDPLLKNV